ncbi:hypothetical protein CP061683_0746A, partial [Chlamydia psittaci 06-1683]
MRKAFQRALKRESDLLY